MAQFPRTRPPARAIIGLIAILSAAFASVSAAQEPGFSEEIHLFDVEDEIYPPADCSILFVGSSSIRFWFRLAADFPKSHVIRRGYGGSTVADTNFYFDRIVARYRPRQIVFYAGENDVNMGKSPEDVLGDIRTFMDKKTAALGLTPVFYVSIKPSKARAADFEAQSRANSLVAEFAANRSDMVYVDVASAMMENGAPRDIFIDDGLHMNSAGYEIWREIIARALKREKISKAPYCK